MKVKFEQLLMGALSVLTALSVMFMLSYTQLKLTAQQSYSVFGMSENSVTMKSYSKPKAAFDDIIDVDKDNDVLVISRDTDSAIIGVYDPSMVMAFQNTYVLMGYTRYFSHQDYVNKAKSGIVISDSLTHDINAWKSHTSEEIEDVMYATDTQSRFNDFENTSKVVNMASLDILGEYIYLDYGDKEAANRIIDRLIDLGYYRFDEEYIGLMATILGSFQSGPFGIIMVSGLMIYLSFGIVAYWHFYNRSKEITIHFLHGGTLIRAAKNTIKEFVTLSFIGAIPIFIFSVLQRRTGYLIMSNVSVMLFIITHIIFTIFMYILAFSVVYGITRNRKRDELYVR
jgi:hypothetical protein